MTRNEQHGDERDTPTLQIEEVDLNALGEALIELSARLREAGEQVSGKVLLDPMQDYCDDDGRALSHREVLDDISEVKTSFKRTLTAMRQFHRDYNRWERLAAEYALGAMGYSQRDAATALGVATSTINRWAQHPLEIEDYR